MPYASQMAMVAMAWEYMPARLSPSRNPPEAVCWPIRYFSPASTVLLYLLSLETLWVWPAARNGSSAIPVAAMVSVRLIPSYTHAPFCRCCLASQTSPRATAASDRPLPPLSATSLLRVAAPRPRNASPTIDPSPPPVPFRKSPVSPVTPGLTRSADLRPGGGTKSFCTSCLASSCPGGSLVTSLSWTFTSSSFGASIAGIRSGSSPSNGLARSCLGSSGGLSSVTTVSSAVDIGGGAGLAMSVSTVSSAPTRATWTAPLATHAGMCLRTSRWCADSPVGSARRMTAAGFGSGTGLPIAYSSQPAARAGRRVGRFET